MAAGAPEVVVEAGRNVIRDPVAAVTKHFLDDPFKFLAEWTFGGLVPVVIFAIIDLVVRLNR